jgi:iron(III) transport system ATP-binding protein
MKQIPSKGVLVQDLSHRYGDFVSLRGVSLELAPGRVHCLVGASGSGKSTLLRNIAGLERLTAGSIHIDGQVVSNRNVQILPEQRNVGYLFQDFALFPHLSVARNIAFGLKSHSREQRRDRVTQLLQQVGLLEYEEAMPHRLSGGQQQRVALARALAPRPSVMLLDEPFSGLDTALRREVSEITLRLLRESETPTLMVTHDPMEALNCGDRISAMDHGVITQTGSPTEIYQQAVDAETARIFGPINVLPVTKQGKQIYCQIGQIQPDWELYLREQSILIRPEMLGIEPALADTSQGQITRLNREVGGFLATVVTSRGGELFIRCGNDHSFEVGQHVRIRFVANAWT